MSDAYNKICYLYRLWFQKKRVAKPPEVVKELFKKYSENGTMTVSNLREYLVDVQGEKEATEDDAKAIIKKNPKQCQKFRSEGLSLTGFFHYLLSGRNHPLTVVHDMSKPLAHYFLYTSHDSCLKTSKFTLTNGTEFLVKALKRGVRVFELELRPNSDQSDIVVCDERTHISSVTIKEYLQVIKENAFDASKYPVILILECNLDTNLQNRLARRITKTFDEMLCPPDQEFNSPESNKKKIILFTRLPKECPENVTETIMDTMNKNEITEAYKNLMGVHIKELEGEFANQMTDDHDRNKVKVFSLSKNHLENSRRTHGYDIIRFTQNNILLVHPNLNRNLISNYDPLIGWTYGAQLVALNMKDFGKHLWIMQGMFRANDRCGYFKKPQILLNENEVFDPTAWRPVKKILKVKVYMGTGWHLDFDSKEFDLTSKPDFFTAIEIVGVPADEAREKTMPVMDEWIPEWNQEFEFPLTVPELAFLMIEVREFDTDRTHDFGGQTCLPVSGLGSGIRSVRLYDEKGKPYRSARLLMHFQFE